MTTPILIECTTERRTQVIETLKELKWAMDRMSPGTRVWNAIDQIVCRVAYPLLVDEVITPHLDKFARDLIKFSDAMFICDHSVESCKCLSTVAGVWIAIARPPEEDENDYEEDSGE